MGTTSIVRRYYEADACRVYLGSVKIEYRMAILKLDFLVVVVFLIDILDKDEGMVSLDIYLNFKVKYLKCANRIKIILRILYRI